MPGAGIKPDVVSYNATILACGKGGKREEALSLLKEMYRASIKPNVVSYNAAISACEKGGKWKEVLSLLEAMRSAGVKPNVISYNATISACEKGQEMEGSAIVAQGDAPHRHQAWRCQL